MLALAILSGAGCEGVVTGLGPTGTSGSGPVGSEPDAVDDPRGPMDLGWDPTQKTCAPVLARRVTRLSDRHLSHAVGDLLAIARPPIETGSLAQAAFLPGKAAAVNASVAVKLREVAETASRTWSGSHAASLTCAGAEADCARAFIQRFATRAFRRTLTEAEASELLAVYSAGRELEGTYAGGVGLVVETVLQSPSFVYLTELGARGDDGLHRLTARELASKLALYLTDTVADDTLWAAAESGKLETEAGLAAEVDRMLDQPAVQTNLSGALARFFDLESLPDVHKDESLPGLTAALPASLHAEASWFIDDVLWRKTGSLEELFTSRTAKLDPVAAALYGVPHPTGKGLVEVMLPSAQRAGILTRAGLMAVKAHDKDTSVVFRGLMVARGLLCANPPPPDPEAVAQGEQLRKTIPTERGRAEARLELSCKGCHRSFDPFGIPFEMYGPLGEFRTTIPTASGNLPVDPTFEIAVADIQGTVLDAVELSERLADSSAVRECMVSQVASFALGERLAPGDTCTAGQLATQFEQTGGNLRQLLKDVATWPALRTRRSSEEP